MTEGACPIPTPEQARFLKVAGAIQSAMLEKITAAITEAHEAAGKVPPVHEGEPPLSLGFLTAVAHHWLFSTLCGADPETGKGGDPVIAAAVLRNFQGVAKRWESAPPAAI